MQLLQQELTFKIIDYKLKEESILTSKGITVEGKAVHIECESPRGRIKMEGQTVSESTRSHKIVGVRLEVIRDYEKFYSFRKKYKTLENIARKI